MSETEILAAVREQEEHIKRVRSCLSQLGLRHTYSQGICLRCGVTMSPAVHAEQAEATQKCPTCARRLTESSAPHDCLGYQPLMCGCGHLRTEHAKVLADNPCLGRWEYPDVLNPRACGCMAFWTPAPTDSRYSAWRRNEYKANNDFAARHNQGKGGAR